MPEASASGTDAGGTARHREHNQGNQGRTYTVDQKAAVLRIRKCNATAFYDILGLETVRSSCTDSDIKKAYRKQSLLTHPDKNGHEHADEAFKMVSRAFGILGDKEKREKYDKYGTDPDSRFESARQQNPFSGFGSRQAAAAGGGGWDDEMSPEEMFARFFGGGGGPFGGGGGPFGGGFGGEFLRELTTATMVAILVWQNVLMIKRLIQVLSSSLTLAAAQAFEYTSSAAAGPEQDRERLKVDSLNENHLVFRLCLAFSLFYYSSSYHSSHPSSPVAPHLHPPLHAWSSTPQRRPTPRAGQHQISTSSTLSYPQMWPRIASQN